MERVRSVLRKGFRSRKGLAVLLVGLLLIASPYMMGVLNPGFEGAKAYFYGLYFPGTSWSGYSGTNVLHKYQAAEDPIIRETHMESAIGPTVINTVSWTSLGTPNDAGVGFTYQKQFALSGQQTSCKPDLKIHIENNLQLQDINRQGDPLGWNDSQPMDARRIEYWAKQIMETSQTNDTTNQQTITSFQYTYKKESFILAPVEFWVGFYLVPAQDNNGGTGSGWREGEWQNMVVWIMLDFNVWDNAYRDAWLNDPTQDVFTASYNGSITSRDRTYEYRGGFPISGWIQGWDKAGWTSSMSQDEGPVWANRRGKGGDAYYTADQLTDLKNQLMCKVQFSPGLVGQSVNLYNQPSVDFQYKSDLTGTGFSDPQLLTSDVKAPDSTMHKVMYFPINIENFGSLAVGDWWNGWNVYYPEAYFRIRMIYGVYGTFTYLWTEQVTQPWEEGGLEFPEKVEIAGTTVIHTEGAGAWTAGITDFFTSPGGLLWTFFVIMVIVIIFVTVANPGMWTALAMSRKRRKYG
jgi:hypothetical protein